MPKRFQVPSAFESSSFSYAEGIEAGLTPGQLRSKTLHAPFVGVRNVVAPVTRTDRALALGRRLRGGQAISGLAAAALWGLRVPTMTRVASNQVEVLTRLSASRVRIRGVTSRAVRDDLFRTRLLGGVPVVSPVLAVLTSAWHLKHEDVTVMLDALLTRSDVYRGLKFPSRPHLVPEQFAEMSARFKGMRGIQIVRQASELARTGVESPMESILRLKLINAGLAEPVIQPRIQLLNGTEYRPDLGYPEAKIYLNYDGEHHFVDQATIDADVLRDRRLREMDISLIHVVKADLNGDRWDELVRTIRIALLKAS